MQIKAETINNINPEKSCTIHTSNPGISIKNNDVYPHKNIEPNKDKTLDACLNLAILTMSPTK